MANKKARMLVDHFTGETTLKCNQLINAPAETVKKLVDAGLADDSPAAVKYATELAKATAADEEPVIEDEE